MKILVVTPSFNNMEVFSCNNSAHFRFTIATDCTDTKGGTKRSDNNSPAYIIMVNYASIQSCRMKDYFDIVTQLSALLPSKFNTKECEK